MVTVKGAGTDYPTHPAVVCASICIDVIDLGAKATKWGLKEHVRLAFATTETYPDKDGVERPAILMTTMTKTIGKDSNLRKFLEGWRGKGFTAEELEDGFDIDDLLDVPAMLNVVHSPAPDGSKTFANIQTATRVPRGVELPDLDLLTYVRFRDRTPQEQADYLARFRGEQIAAPNQRGGGRAQAPAPAAPQGTAKNRRTAAAAASAATQRGMPKKVQPPVEEDFDEFPAALEDEDDDLPF